MSIKYSIFAVNETSYCVWDWDIKSVNTAFLESIDPKYFEYAAHTNVANLDSEQKQFAATAVRVAFYHALETFFALIFGALQAPDCVVGWVQKYQPAQLRKMIKQINSGLITFPYKLKISKLSWESISAHINLFSYPEEERTIETKQLFARLWRRFADEYLSEDSTLEYNSIKHGFRAKSGGFALAIGIEDQPGVPAPPEKMHLLGQSEFGNSFFRAEQILESKNDPHLRIVPTSVNWNPVNTANATLLLSQSIGNIVSYLRIANGADPKTVRFSRPVESSAFDLPWPQIPGVSSVSMGSEVTDKVIVKYSRKQLSKLLQADPP